MKYTQIIPFIQCEKSARVYLIAAADVSVRAFCQDVLLVSVKGEVTALEQPSKALLQQELGSGSLFSQDRVVVARFADSAPKDVAEYLEECSFEGVTLVLVVKKLLANSKLFKRLEKEGVAFTQGELKPWEKEKELMEWVRWQSMRSEVRTGDAVGMDLIRRCSGDLMMLKSEWDKLLLYIGDRKQIVPGDLEAVCPKSSHETLWELGQACIDGRGALASKIGTQLLEQNTALIAMIRHLRMHYQNLYQVRTLLESGQNPHLVTQDVPYLKGRKLESLIQTARQSQGVGKKIALLDQMEGQAKTASADDGVLLDLLLFQLTGS